MAAQSTIIELRKMPRKDLEREVRSQRATVAKLRLAVHMQKEKNSAKYSNEKKQLARMMTVLEEIRRNELSSADSGTTVSAQSAS